MGLSGLFLQRGINLEWNSTIGLLKPLTGGGNKKLSSGTLIDCTDASPRTDWLVFFKPQKACSPRKQALSIGNLKLTVCRRLGWKWSKKTEAHEVCPALCYCELICESTGARHVSAKHFLQFLQLLENHGRFQSISFEN